MQDESPKWPMKMSLNNETLTINHGFSPRGPCEFFIRIQMYLRREYRAWY